MEHLAKQFATINKDLEDKEWTLRKVSPTPKITTLHFPPCECHRA